MIKNGKYDVFLWWGGLLGSFFLAKYVSDFDFELAKKIFIAGIFWYVGFPLYAVSKEETLRLTWHEFTGCLYIIGIVLIMTLIFAILMPKSCTRKIDDMPESTDLYFRR